MRATTRAPVLDLVDTVEREAVEAKEAVGEDSAGEVATQLTLDEAGHRMIALAGACEKRLEVLADALV